MFTAMFFTAVAFGVLAVVAWWAGNSRTWQGWEPNYALFSWAKDNFLLVAACGLLGVWFLVGWWFLRRALKSTETLLQAAKRLAHPDEQPIRLPAALKAAEDELNLAREQALRSAYVAREAEQRKNDLIVYLAHDLKTPLTSVVGYLTLLQEEPDLSPEMRARYTGVALDKALRLEDLINEFFEITRFNLSAIELERERVDLSRMLEQMMWEFKPLMADKKMAGSAAAQGAAYLRPGQDGAGAGQPHPQRHQLQRAGQPPDPQPRGTGGKGDHPAGEPGPHHPPGGPCPPVRALLPGGLRPRHPQRRRGAGPCHRKGDRHTPLRANFRRELRQSGHLHGGDASVIKS